MLPLVEWGDERAQLWERKALNTISAGGEFPAIIRALGRLDCFLRRENKRCVDNFAKVDVPNAYLLEDFLALSQLWVFEALEMLRSLEKRIRPPSETVSAEVWKRVKSFKARMARIRAPLAKLTPTTGFAHVDEVPRGACVVNNAKDKGWCWQLNATTYVWRHDLGDELLSLLDGFPNPWAEKRND